MIAQTVQPEARPAKDIAGFDGLRALAALTVLSYHVVLWTKFTGAGWLTPALWELKGGVAIFFVISGSLLYLPYARALRDRHELPDWRGYARRRVVRIVPAYWVALTVLAFGPFRAAVLGSDIWRYYGLSQIYASTTLFNGLGVAWSLCVEVSFYALLPLFARLLARLAQGRRGAASVRLQLALIAVAGLATIALRGAMAGSLSMPFYHRGPLLMVALPGLLDWFAIGMALAVLRAELEAGRAARSRLAALALRPGSCVLLALAVLAVAMRAQHGDMFLPWYGLATHVCLGLGSGLLVLPVIAGRGAAANRLPIRVLKHPVAAWLGTISYGVYLWQLPVLELIAPRVLSSAGPAPTGVAALLWLAVLAGSIACGAASWYLVERPVQRLVKARVDARTSSDPAGHMPEIETSVQPQAEAA